MTHPPKHIPQEVHAKWLALRQKHQQDSTEFQCQVMKNRAEFESRIDKARKGLLAKHINEERDFWSKAGQVPKNTASATKTTPKQPPVTAKSTATGSRQTTIPARTPASRPATPNDRPRPSNAPAKASQGPKSSQVPPAAPKPRKQPLKKISVLEVIDLISDDEESSTPAKKTPATSVSVATGTTRKRPIDQESDSQESASPDHTPKKPSFSIPGATLELFGSPSTKHAVGHAPLHFKDEIDLISSARLFEPTPPPPMSPQSQFHGLPVSVPSTSSTLSPLASTTPQLGISGIMAPLTPPSTPGFGGSRSDHLSSGFPPRAARGVPHTGQPFATNTHFAFPSYQQPGRFGPGSTANPAPASSSFTFPTQSSRFSSPLSRGAGPDISTSSPLGTQGLQEPCQTSDRPRDSSQNLAQGKVEQEISIGEPSSSAHQKERHMTEAPKTNTNLSVPHVSNVQLRSGDVPSPNQDVPMSDASTVLSKHMTLAAASYPSPALKRDMTSNVVLSEPSHTPRTPQRQQLPSPPPSHTSVASEPLTTSRQDVFSSSSAFKKPSAPASATPNQPGHQSVAAEARHVCAGTIDSRASSFTVPASSHNKQSTSVASRISDISSRTSVTRTRKRKVEVSVSSDEEDDEISDYAPSELDSPSADKSVRRSKNETVAKKIKTMTSSVPSSRLASARSTNAFGFKAMTPKPRATTTAASSSIATSKKNTSSGPTASKMPSKSAPRSASIENPRSTPKAFTHSNKRRAAKDSETKTQKILQDVEEFNTECAIEEADQFEDARLPDDMQRMSITPSPPTRSRDGEETFEMLTDQTSASTTNTKNGKDGYTYRSWIRDRMAGDRALNRTRSRGEEDEDGSEIDMDDEAVEELDLTGEA